MISVGVIGYGYWGPNLVRNFSESPDTQVLMVSDLSADRLKPITKRYPTVQLTTDYLDILNNPAIDAVAIATPVSTHFPLAMEALKAGKHVWVEKPMTSSTAEAEILVEEAARRNLTLIVDHTFVYTGAVRKIHELTSSGEIGDIYYYDSMRVNLGLFQRDVNVIWDLAVHDLSIMENVISANPCAVTATGISHVAGNAENIAYITCFFDDNVIAHINVNWLSPVKIRQTLIAGSKQMIVYDDMEPSEKIKLYDKGITVNGNPDAVYQMLIGYRSGDMRAPRIDLAEGLQTEVKHFAQCIREKKSPITDGHAGLRVVSILEAASESIKDRGRLVELKRNGAPKAQSNGKLVGAAR